MEKSWNNEWIKALSVGKREEQPNMDGNVSARRIVCVAVRERATNSSNGFFVSQLIDLIAVYYAICADRVQSGLSPQPGSGPTFDLKFEMCWIPSQSSVWKKLALVSVLWGEGESGSVCGSSGERSGWAGSEV